MEVVLTLALMVGIGAAIGGVTNSLAIKMLFRPYNPIYFGKKKLPFTPGLIPRRREELAKQLGEMVVNHLLTAEGLANKINDSAFKFELTSWLKKELEQILDDGTLEMKISKWFHIEDPKGWLKGNSAKFLEKKIQEILRSYEHKEMEAILPITLQGKVDTTIPKLAEIILEKLIKYIESSEGKTKLSKMIDNFLAGKGMVGNMINMFLGNDQLVDKVQPELVKLLKKRDTVTILEKLLRNEWEKFKKADSQKILKHIDEASVSQSVSSFIIEKAGLDNILEAPLGTIVGTYREKILDELLPNIVDQAIRKLVTQMDSLLEKLHLQHIVQAQVETFSVARLEELILGISKREFKMITYLGALLGGIIGLFQGILVYFIQ
jgi:uncharacterized membrane protein YheB (UPF0754 family)